MRLFYTRLFFYMRVFNMTFFTQDFFYTRLLHETFLLESYMRTCKEGTFTSFHRPHGHVTAGPYFKPPHAFWNCFFASLLLFLNLGVVTEMLMVCLGCWLFWGASRAKGAQVRPDKFSHSVPKWIFLVPWSRRESTCSSTEHHSNKLMVENWRKRRVPGFPILTNKH